MAVSVFGIGLGVVLYGVFFHHWYINELSAVFPMMTLASGIVSGMDRTTFSSTVLRSVVVAAPGAFMVGYATSIKVLMEMGSISDTITHYFSEYYRGYPTIFQIFLCLFLKV